MLAFTLTLIQAWGEAHQKEGFQKKIGADDRLHRTTPLFTSNLPNPSGAFSLIRHDLRDVIHALHNLKNICVSFNQNYLPTQAEILLTKINVMIEQCAPNLRNKKDHLLSTKCLLLAAKFRLEAVHHPGQAIESLSEAHNWVNSISNHVTQRKIRFALVEAQASAARAQATSGDVAQAKATFKRATYFSNEIKDQYDEFSKSNALEILAKQEVLAALARSNKPQQAKPIYARAVKIINNTNGEERIRRARMISEAAKAFACAGYPQEASDIFNKAIALSTKTNCELEIATIAALVAKALASAALAQAALGAHDEVKINLKNAMRLVNHIPYSLQHHRYDARKAVMKTHVSAALAQASLGEPEEAKATLESSFQAMNTRQDALETIMVLNEIAKAQTMLGHINEAKSTFKVAVEIADAISEASIQAEALQSIAKAQAMSNHSAEAQKPLHSAIKAAIRITDACDLARAFYKIAETYAALGDEYHTKIFFEQAVGASDAIEHKSRASQMIYMISMAQASAAYTLLAHSLKNAENAEEFVKAAIETANKMADTGDRDRTLFGIVEIQALAAQDTLMDDPGLRKSTLASAMNTAKKIQGQVTYIAALTKIAMAHAKVEDTRQTHAALMKALIAAKQIKDAPAYTRAVYLIAETQSKLGQFEHAITTITMDADDDKTSSLVDLVGKAFLELVCNYYPLPNS